MRAKPVSIWSHLSESSFVRGGSVIRSADQTYYCRCFCPREQLVLKQQMSSPACSISKTSPTQSGIKLLSDESPLLALAKYVCNGIAWAITLPYRNQRTLAPVEVVFMCHGAWAPGALDTCLNLDLSTAFPGTPLNKWCWWLVHQRWQLCGRS